MAFQTVAFRSTAGLGLVQTSIATAETSTLELIMRFMTPLCLIVLAGCPGGGGPPRETSSIADPSVSYDFVLSSISIDPNDSSPATGFDLDELCSTGAGYDGCFTSDRLSSIDSDQNEAGCVVSSGSCQGSGCPSGTATCQGCVDNVLPQVVDDLDANMTGLDVRQEMSAALEGGKLVYLLRLSGVDSPIDDPDVSVALVAGFSIDSFCSSLFTGSGEFVVNNDWLLSTGEPAVFAHGYISDGRLSVQFPSAPQFGALAAGFWETLKLRVDLAESLDAGSRGNLGGSFDLPAVTALLQVKFPSIAGLISYFMPLDSDLRRPSDGVCSFLGDAAGGGRLALGSHFGMVRATITGSASTATSGACGGE